MTSFVTLPGRHLATVSWCTYSKTGGNQWSHFCTHKNVTPAHTQSSITVYKIRYMFHQSHNYINVGSRTDSHGYTMSTTQHQTSQSLTLMLRKLFAVPLQRLTTGWLAPDTGDCPVPGLFNWFPPLPVLPVPLSNRAIGCWLDAIRTRGTDNVARTILKHAAQADSWFDFMWEFVTY